LFKSSPHYVAPQDFNGRKGSFTILTPENYDERGAQLSLRFPDGDMPLVFAEMIKRGVMGDERNPSLIRFAPIPLYCTFKDCRRAADALNQVLDALQQQA